MVKGLRKGATYEISIYGQMREEAAHADEDPFRYRVQWGYAAGGSAQRGRHQELGGAELGSDQRPHVAGLDAAVQRPLLAPADKIVLGVRAWKKWGTGERELDVNLDAIKLGRAAALPRRRRYCLYTVKKGDTLGAIAAKYHTTVAYLVQAERHDEPEPDLRGPEAEGAVRPGAAAAAVIPLNLQ